MKGVKYFEAYKMGVQKSMEYKVDFWFGLLSAVFPIIVQVYLWSAIYSHSESDTHYGYTFYQILLYTFMAGVVAQFLGTGVEQRINEDIHTGQLGSFLVKPVSYAPFRLFSVMGEKLFSGSALTVVVIIIAIIFPIVTGVGIKAANALSFVIILLFSFLLSFLLFYCIGLTGLWFIEIGQLFGAVRITLLVFTGGVFPLEVFGETLFAIMKFLPFMYITYFPVNVLHGSITGREILFGIFMQLIWTLIFSLLAKIMWSRGLKKYAPVGG